MNYKLQVVLARDFSGFLFIGLNPEYVESLEDYDDGLAPDFNLFCSKETTIAILERELLGVIR